MPQPPILADKGELLAKLEENRDRHRRVFDKTMERYVAQLQSELELRLQAISNGRVPDPVIHLTTPRDHTQDYDRVIAMVKMHQGTTFPLDERNFAHYVMDQWEWKDQWARISNSYAADYFEEEYGSNGG